MLVDQKILQFEVTMSDTLGVTISQGSCSLAEEAFAFIITHLWK